MGDAEDSFDILIDRRVTKRMRKLPAKHYRQVTGRINQFTTTPQPQDAIKLKGNLNGYRVDVGEYRILYRIDYENKMVEVYLVIQRGEGYPNRM